MIIRDHGVMRVLVVDDDAAVHDSLTWTLRFEVWCGRRDDERFVVVADSAGTATRPPRHPMPIRCQAETSDWPGQAMLSS